MTVYSDGAWPHRHGPLRMMHKSYYIYLKTKFPFCPPPFNPYPICVWNRDFFSNFFSNFPQLLMMTRLLCPSESWEMCSRAHSLQPDTIFHQITDLFFVSQRTQVGLFSLPQNIQSDYAGERKIGETLARLCCSFTFTVHKQQICEFKQVTFSEKTVVSTFYTNKAVTASHVSPSQNVACEDFSVFIPRFVTGHIKVPK